MGTRSAPVRKLVLAMGTAGLALLWWRRRAARRRPPEDGGGGLAGDREPRRPVPPTLVDAGAGVPGA